MKLCEQPGRVRERATADGARDGGRQPTYFDGDRVVYRFPAGSSPMRERAVVLGKARREEGFFFHAFVYRIRLEDGTVLSSVFENQLSLY